MTSTPTKSLPGTLVDEEERAGEASAARSGDTGDFLPVVESATYAIKGEIARGGVGRVLHAWDNLFKRSVAIKELLPDASMRAAGRFLREALVTARLQHPGVVPVYQAGRWPSGEPFYAMKLVDGRSLEDVIKEMKTLPERLALLPNVLAAAETIAYAHEEGIIHRDIKPSNILVGAFGETLLADWGLNKEIGRPPDSIDDLPPDPALRIGHGSPHVTQQGTVLGTPSYMPPEQANGEEVDRRCDVYALGALLYHVLSGVPPYEGPTALETLLMVIARPPPPLAELAPGAPPDLLAIVDKAMAREPADRYPTGKAFADDLRRFMTGQLVGAQRYTRRALFRRWVRRNVLPVSIGAAALLTLSVVLAGSFLRIQEERDAAELARGAADTARLRETARADELVLVQARHMLDVDPTAALAWLGKLSPDTRQLYAARTIADDARERGTARIFRGHSDRVYRLAFSPDGRRFASWGLDRRIRLWDPEANAVQEINAIGAAGDALGGEIAYSADGRLLMTRLDGQAVLFDLLGGQIVFETERASGDEQDATYRAISGDGRRVAVGSHQGLILIEVATKERQRLLSGSFIEPPRPFFAPDGSRLGAITDSGIRVFDVGTKKERLFKVPDDVHRAQFSPDGKLIACSTKHDGKIRIFDVEKQKIRVLAGHGESVRSFLFSPSGRALASAGAFDGNVLLWDVETGKARVWERKDPTLMAFSPDGGRLALVLLAKVELIDLRSNETKTLAGHQEEISSIAFSPDGNALLTGSFDTTVRRWDLADGPDKTYAGEGEEPLVHFALSSDGRRLAATSREGAVVIRDLESGAVHSLGFEGARTLATAFGEDGAILAALEDGSVWRTKDQLGPKVRMLEGLHVASEAEIGFSPRSTMVAVFGAASTEIEIGDLSTGRLRSLSAPEGNGIRALAFCEDDACLATGEADGAVRLRHALTGSVVRTLEGRQERIASIAISGDGRYVAAGDAREIRLFDLSTGARRSLHGHERGFSIVALAFSPGAHLLASAAQDGSARLWDVKSGEGRALKQAAAVLFARKAEPLVWVAAGQNGVRRWRDRLPWDPAKLWARLSAEALESGP